MSRQAVSLFVLAVSILVLVLGLLSPAWVIADAAQDDLRFVRSAAALGEGGWLGPYDNTTLLKGPGFPLWLALVSPFPLGLANQALHLAAAGLLSAVIGRVLRAPWAGVLLFLVLALDPSYLGAGAVRVARDGWYGSVCLLLLAASAWLLTRPSRQDEGVVAQTLSIIGAGLLLGVLGGVYWLGREERIWMAPSLALLLLIPVLRLRRSTAGSGEPGSVDQRSPMVVALAGVVIAGMVSAALVSAVAAKNRSEYGAELVTDFADGEFVRAYGLWQSVEAGPARRFVPVSRTQRAAAYAVSPTAATLQAAIDGLEQTWVPPGCQALSVCDDFAGGWFPFALRDAVATTGNYADAALAQAFYARLADELEGACASGVLRCGSVPSGLSPVRSQIDFGAVMDSAVEGAVYLARFEVAETTRPDSQGTPEHYRLFQETVGGLAPDLQGQLREEKSDAARSAVAETLSWVYALGAGITVVPALAGYVLAVRARTAAAAWLIGMACGGAVLVRLALLAVVDATSFPAARTAYVLPASSLLVAFLAIGCLLLVRTRRPHSAGSAPAWSARGA